VITYELERAASALIVSLLLASDASAAAGGELADGGQGLLVSLPQGLPGTLGFDGQRDQSDDNGIPIIGDKEFRVYRGSGSEQITFPCAIVQAHEASEDFDTGNVTVRLSVSIQYQADDPDDSTSRPEYEQQVANIILDGMRTDSLPTDLNTNRVDADRLTVIGLIDASQTMRREGRATVFEADFTLYCAGLDLT